MKVHLMFEDRDFDLEGSEPPNKDQLIQDLRLASLLEAMSRGDKFLHRVAEHALLLSLTQPQEINYRQQVLNDCLTHPEIIREIYTIATEAIVREQKIYRPWFARESKTLRRSIEVLEMFTELLRRLHQIALDQESIFQSKGFKAFFATLRTNLDEEYFQIIDAHLKRLKFKEGVLMSARLGKGNKGIDYVLHPPVNTRQGWKERIGLGPRTSYSFEIAPRDEAGVRALTELANRGLNLVAYALAQSSEHILSFFSTLATEIGFYVSCLNLHEQLIKNGEPVCMPIPTDLHTHVLNFQELYDISLSIQTEKPVVGNSIDADGKLLTVITGANSGGKSTFLRSIGIAQLMMQCGMFVGAKYFRANVCNGIFTHFIREEDATMTSGKLDEELGRMSVIADQITAHAMVLFNESFAATNEREGSEIARQIVNALLEADIKIFFVTHLFTFSEYFYHKEPRLVAFLQAQRQEDGGRNFKIVAGEPLPTSYAEDILERIGGLTS